MHAATIVYDGVVSLCSFVAIFFTLGKYVQFSWSTPMQKRLSNRLLGKRQFQLEDFESSVTSGLF